MKSKAPLIVIFIFTAAILLIYLFKDKIKSFFAAKTPDAAPAGNNTTTTVIKYVKDPVDDVPNIVDIDKDLLLKRGSSAKAEVKYLQNLINKALKVKKKTLLSPDGSFGAKTENALYYLIKKKQCTISEFVTIMIQTLGKGL